MVGVAVTVPVCVGVGVSVDVPVMVGVGVMLGVGQVTEHPRAALQFWHR
jgi:hypothetical protein